MQLPASSNSARVAGSRTSEDPSEGCLVGEAFSPWTQKARWALECCGVPFAYREYTPALSEPRLRWNLRQWRGTVSVPVLLTGRRAIRGSWDIARHADAHADVRGRLGTLERIAGWNARADAGLAEGRARLLQAMEHDPNALDESLPLALHAALLPVCRPLTRHAIRRLQHKYSHLVRAGAMRDALHEARTTLDANGGTFLLGSFSYADIVAATLLEMIEPRATGCALGPAGRRCWTHPARAAEFADLLAWRERLLAIPGCAPSWWRMP